MKKRFFTFFIFTLLANFGFSQINQNLSELPNFSSLAEKVMPSVVNVSVTKVIKSPAR